MLTEKSNVVKHKLCKEFWLQNFQLTLHAHEITVTNNSDI